jgi:hypothetical protein
MRRQRIFSAKIFCISIDCKEYERNPHCLLYYDNSNSAAYHDGRFVPTRIPNACLASLPGFSREALMRAGKLVFAHVMEWAPWHTVRRLIAKYRGEFNIRTSVVWTSFYAWHSRS